jgi:outer membrane lipoprotein-sorting protein
MHRILLTCLFFLAALILHAQQKPLDPAGIAKLRAGVRAASAGTSTISSDFTQEKEMQIMKDKIISSGKFYFKKEKLLRWEYTTPYSYLIVINNTKISVKDEQKTSTFNLSANKVFAEINNIIMGSVQGTLLSDDKTFSPEFYENGASYIARLKPLSAKLKESLSEIVIFFDKSDFSVTRIEMYEPNKDCTRISFTGKKFNLAIPDEKFVVK